MNAFSSTPPTPSDPDFGFLASALRRPGVRVFWKPRGNPDGTLLLACGPWGYWLAEFAVASDLLTAGDEVCFSSYSDPPLYKEPYCPLPPPPASSPNAPRPAVLWFAEQMQAKLKKNAHKGGWETCSLGYLVARIENEIEEMAATSTPEELLEECADVANFAMILADILTKRIEVSLLPPVSFRDAPISVSKNCEGAVEVVEEGQAFFKLRWMKDGSRIRHSLQAESSLEEVSPSRTYRPVVSWFAEQIEYKLQDCFDHKEGWKIRSSRSLVVEEMEEDFRLFASVASHEEGVEVCVRLACHAAEIAALAHSQNKVLASVGSGDLAGEKERPSALPMPLLLGMKPGDQALDEIGMVWTRMDTPELCFRAISEFGVECVCDFRFDGLSRLVIEPGDHHSRQAQLINLLPRPLQRTF